jgi:hypothetical protein
MIYVVKANMIYVDAFGLKPRWRRPAAKNHNVLKQPVCAAQIVHKISAPIELGIVETLNVEKVVLNNHKKVTNSFK